MHGYSLKAIAKKIGCSPNTVSNWEKGIGSPKMHFLQELCKLYEITPNQFLGFEPCDKLDNFADNNKSLLDEIDRLEQEKADIESTLRMYYKMLNPNQRL